MRHLEKRRHLMNTSRRRSVNLVPLRFERSESGVERERRTLPGCVSLKRRNLVNMLEVYEVVSVVVPVYKCEQTLHGCVKSLQGQTVREIEIILVDDGSPDGCPGLCDKLAEEDTRIRVVHKSNGGVSSARNAGIEAALGEFLLFVDSDDWVEADLVERLLERMGEADLVLCGYHHHYMGRDVEKIPGTEVWQGAESFLELYGRGFLNMPWNKLFRREAAGRFDEGLSLGEDLLFNLDYLRRTAGRAAIVKRPLYHYIQNDTGNTLSSKKREDKLELGKRIWREASGFYQELAGHGDELGVINARLIQEVLDDVEHMPFDHSRTKREKLAAIEAYCRDPELRQAGRNAALSALDYRLIHGCMRRGWKRSAYLLSVMRSWAVRMRG